MKEHYKMKQCDENNLKYKKSYHFGKMHLRCEA